MSITSTHKPFVTTFIKFFTISEIVTIWPSNSTKETGWGHNEEPNLHLMKYIRPILACTNLHLFYNVLQNDLSPCTHHYFIYLLRIFLRILIFGYPDSNTAIISSTSSHASNKWVAPFFSQSATSNGIWIIISNPSNGKTLLRTIGYTDIFWIETKDIGHTMNASQKKRIHHTLNPSAFMKSRIKHFTLATHPKWKLKNPVLCRKYSRLRWGRPQWTCCPKIYMAATMLNVLSQHIINPLYFFSLWDFFIC